MSNLIKNMASDSGIAISKLETQFTAGTDITEQVDTFASFIIGECLEVMARRMHQFEIPEPVITDICACVDEHFID